MHISLRIEIEKKNFVTFLLFQKKKLWHKFKNAEKKIDIKSREKVLFSIFIYSISNSYISLSIYFTLFSRKNSGFYNWRSSSFFLSRLSLSLSISSTCCCLRRLIKYSNDSHFFYVIIITFHLNMTRFISYSISHWIQQQQQQRKSCRKQE